MLLDDLWGGIAILPFDWSHPSEMTVGISLVVGLPCYLLDAFSRRRIIVFLPALFAFRWLALTLGEPQPRFFIPWVNALIVLAAILLQWSKLRSPAIRVIDTAGHRR